MNWAKPKQPSIPSEAKQYIIEKRREIKNIGVNVTIKLKEQPMNKDLQHER